MFTNSIAAPAMSVSQCRSECPNTTCEGCKKSTKGWYAILGDVVTWVWCVDIKYGKHSGLVDEDTSAYGSELEELVFRRKNSNINFSGLVLAVGKAKHLSFELGRLCPNTYDPMELNQIERTLEHSGLRWLSEDRLRFGSYNSTRTQEEVDELVEYISACIPGWEAQIEGIKGAQALRRKEYGSAINQQLDAAGASKEEKKAYWSMQWRREVTPELFVTLCRRAQADENFAAIATITSRKLFERFGWMHQTSVPRNEDLVSAIATAIGVEKDTHLLEDLTTRPQRWVFGA